MSTVIQFFVPGLPKAQPRARSFAVRGPGGKVVMKNGQPIIRVHEAGTAENWKSQIALAAKTFGPMPPLHGPLRMDVDFVFPRPLNHYKSQSKAATLAGLPRILKSDAPLWHFKKPDRDNLAKAVTDSLKVLGMFSDDCQVCAGEVRKLYATPTGPICNGTMCQLETSYPGAHITIALIEQPKSAPKREEIQEEFV